MIFSRIAASIMIALVYPIVVVGSVVVVTAMTVTAIYNQWRL